jgi:alginate O-acetyltransferase complex protein AlgI
VGTTTPTYDAAGAAARETAGRQWERGMVFSSHLFLFYFLPLALLALRACSTGRRFNSAARLAIIGSTLVFYAYGNLLWPLLFVLTIGGIYLASIPVLYSTSAGIRRWAVAAGVAYAIAVLAFFKYLNWLATLFPPLQDLQALLAPYFGSEGKIVLPPGISFYVFEALSFAIDAKRGRIEKPVRFLDYLTFLAMFPRFIAGPIVRYPDMAAQYHDWRGQKIASGLTIFSL